jgi:hypothetical protein
MTSSIAKIIQLLMMDDLLNNEPEKMWKEGA